MLWKISRYHTGLAMWLIYDYAISRDAARETVRRFKDNSPNARFRIARDAGPSTT